MAVIALLYNRRASLRPRATVASPPDELGALDGFLAVAQPGGRDEWGKAAPVRPRGPPQPPGALAGRDGAAVKRPDDGTGQI